MYSKLQIRQNLYSQPGNGEVECDLCCLMFGFHDAKHDNSVALWEAFQARDLHLSQVVRRFHFFDFLTTSLLLMLVSNSTNLVYRNVLDTASEKCDL